MDPVDPVDPGPVDPGPVDPGPVDPGTPWTPGPVDPGTSWTPVTVAPWTPPVTDIVYHPVDTSGYSYAPTSYATGTSAQQLAVTGGPGLAMLPAAGTALAATGGTLVARRKLSKAMGFGRVAARHGA